MAVTPRDAATVIVARPADDGSYDVLLTRRPESMAFMGGTYVFPGGALEDADRDSAMAERSLLDASTARERLGEDIEPDEALGLFCCALRELYEEAGLLIARDDRDHPVDPAKVREVYAPHHAEVGHDPTRFASFLAEQGLRLSTDLVAPHGRLITPERSPIRFDARFFVAPMPQGQAVIPHPTEVHEWLWIRPAEALERSQKGELEVPIPTLAILQGLAEIPRYDDVLAGRHEPRPVEVTELSPLVTCVLAPNPGIMEGAGTNTYIVGRGDIAIIDPAVADAVYIERVAREAGNRGRVKFIAITHGHIDHIGGIAPLAEQLGVDVVAFDAKAQFVTRAIGDGDVLELGGATLRAIHTPGHAPDHLCFFLEEEGALFAGDVVAGIGTVVVTNLADYMRTLRQLRASDPQRIYPGHGPVIEDGSSKLDGYIAHRQERELQVLDALRSGLRDVPSMVKQIYTDVPEALHLVAGRSVLSHLEVLEADGRVKRSGNDWELIDH